MKTYRLGSMVLFTILAVAVFSSSVANAAPASPKPDFAKQAANVLQQQIPFLQALDAVTCSGRGNTTITSIGVQYGACSDGLTAGKARFSLNGQTLNLSARGPAQAAGYWASATAEPEGSRGVCLGGMVNQLDIHHGGSLTLELVMSYGGQQYPPGKTSVGAKGSFSFCTTIQSGQTNIWWQLIATASGSAKPDQVTSAITLTSVSYAVVGPLL